jgi:ribose transport system permease protein
MKSRDLGKNLLNLASKQKAFLAIVAMFILMLFPETNFYSAYNLLDILNSASVNLIVAAGVTLVIICAGCDLAVGSVLSLSGIMTIMLAEHMPIPLAILCALVFGAFVGFINGFFVVHQKTEPFVITFGMGMVLKGIALQITDAKPIPAGNSEYMMIANTKIFGVLSYLIIIMVVVLIIVHYILRYTQFGRNCYAVGGDFDVAVYAGINARRTKWTAFVISGITAALAGVMLSSKLNAGSAVYGDTVPLFIHCGAVIGGTSLTGGKGGIPQTFLGLLSLSMLLNVMNMLQVGGYIQLLLQGIIIALILWFDNYQVKRKREAI